MNLTALLEFESLVFPGLQNTTMRALVAASLRDVLQRALVEVTTTLMVLVSCRYDGVLDFMRNIMFELRTMPNMTLQLMQQDHRQLLHVPGRHLFNLVLVDSLAGFLDLQLARYVKDYDMNEFSYIFLQQRDHLLDAEMQAVFDYCWRHQMINCNVQTQSAKMEIRMYTYYPYTQQNCSRAVGRQINAFVAGHGWEQQKRIFPNKLQNLNRCPLVVAVRDLPPFLRLYNNNDIPGMLGKSCQHRGIGPRLGGFEGCLMVELANYMNFTLNSTIIEIDDRSRNYCCGIVASLRKQHIHFGIGYYRKRTYMAPFSTDVFPHYQNELVAAIDLNAHNLTAYEILVYPFDGYTWVGAFIALLLVLACAEGMHYSERYTPQTVHSHPQRTRRRFFTLLTLVSTTLGLPLHREPYTSHNRLVFSATMWSTFLLRGIYTAILYSIFRDSIHRALPRNTLDLLRLDYVAVMNTFALRDIQGLPDLSRYRKMRVLVLNDENELVAFPIVLAHEHERYFSLSTREFLVYYSTKNRKPGRFHILPSNVITQQLCIYLIKHSHLVNQMDMTIMRFHAAGLMQFLRQRTLGDKYFHSRHLYGQKFINQRDLIAIYMLVGLLQLLALVVFLLELASRRCSWIRALFARRVELR